MTELVATARRAADAFRAGKNDVLSHLSLPHSLSTSHHIMSGDVGLIGDCLNKYREQKLIMAPGIIVCTIVQVHSYNHFVWTTGSLPASVKFFIEKAGEYIHGEYIYSQRESVGIMFYV